MTSIRRLTTMTAGIVALLVLPASSQADQRSKKDHSDEAERAECLVWGTPGGSPIEDSDFDGLTDEFELHHGLDPSDPDSDGDGILDGDELIGSTFPDDSDTDHDGVPDFDDPDPTGHFETEIRGDLEFVDPVEGSVVVAGSIIDVSAAYFEHALGIGDLQPGMFVEIQIDPDSPVGGPLIAWKVSLEDAGGQDFDSDGQDLDSDGQDFGSDGQDLDSDGQDLDSDGQDGVPNTDPGNVCTKVHGKKTRLTASPGASSAKATAKYEEKNCNGEFEVEVAKLALGSYDLLVDGVYRASIEVLSKNNGKTKGEITFRSQLVKATDLPLNFDPRGVLIEVKQAGELLFSGSIPL